MLTITALLLPFVGGLKHPVQVKAEEGIKLHGVDVSTYQGEIDWPMLAANDISFVIMRGGKRPDEKTDYFTDDRFEQNYVSARNVGLKIGVYLYCGATTWETFEATVYEFLETIEGKQFDYPVYLDVEQAQQEKLGKAVMTQYVLDALAIIKDAGFETGVYANLNWFTNHLDRDAIDAEGYPLWLARYTHDCESYDYSDPYSMWQYSDKGYMPGLGVGATAVDLDVSYVDFNYHPELHPTRDTAYDAYLPLRAHMLEETYTTPYYSDFETKIDGASVFPEDECLIREVYTNGWCRFSYPTNAGDRIGYLPVSVFLPEEPSAFIQTEAEFEMVTCSRENLEEEIGFIARKDVYHIVTEQNGAVMAIYPVSGSWKTGWYLKKVWKAADAALVTDYILGRVSITQRQLGVYDLNGDGIVDVFDLALVRRKVLKEE